MSYWSTYLIWNSYGSGKKEINISDKTAAAA
jgi:hypothetical protein